MNVKILLSLLLVFSGFVILLIRDKPNPFIGIRFGYTYFSKKAWRKANTFAGLYCIILGPCFLVIGIGLPFKIFLGIYVITITSVAYLSYRIAKETYEKEDLSTPVEEFKPMRVSLRDALILEVIPIILYVLAVAVLWNRIPETVAIHFGINFKPDTYASKPVGAYPPNGHVSRHGIDSLGKKGTVTAEISSKYPSCFAVISGNQFLRQSPVQR